MVWLEGKCTPYLVVSAYTTGSLLTGTSGHGSGDEAGVYAMSKEDTYLYLLAHLAKHLKNGGAGIRQILDIWLYLQKEDDGLDKAYLRESLKALELEKLHTTIKELGEYCMHPPVEQSKRL